MKTFKILHRFSTTIKELRNLSLLHIEKKQFPEALSSLKQALNEVQFLNNKDAFLELLDLVSYVQFTLSDYQSLSETLEHKLSLLSTQNTNESDLLQIMKNLFKCYIDSDLFDKALFISVDYPKLLKRSYFSKSFKFQMKIQELTVRIILGEEDTTDFDTFNELINSEFMRNSKALLQNNLGVLTLKKSTNKNEMKAAEALFMDSILESEGKNEKTVKNLLNHVQKEDLGISSSVNDEFDQNYTQIRPFLENKKLKIPVYFNSPNFDTPLANLIHSKLKNKEYVLAQKLILCGIKNLHRLGILDNLHRFWYLCHMSISDSKDLNLVETNLTKATRFAIVNNSVLRNILLNEYAMFLERNERFYEARRVFEMGNDASRDQYLWKEWVLVDRFNFRQKKTI